MPRPKPPDELKPRGVRMTDAEWKLFKEWGGSERLRKLIGSMPPGYFSVFKRNPDAVFLKRKLGEDND